jgi:putative endonuclease
MYYLYILHSETFDKQYIGYTSDLARRLHEHNTSERKTFTSKYRPWRMVAAFKCPGSRAHVIRIERFIKKNKNKKLIQKLIAQEELFGILSQLVRVPHQRD